VANETMTRSERLAAALAFEKPDRVPVVPLFVKSTALSYCGVSQAEGNKDNELALDCMLKTFDDVGGWDALYVDMPDSVLMQVLVWAQPVKWKLPGVDLPEDALMQVDEREIMTIEDYDKLIEEGWDKFYNEDYVYRLVHLEPGTAPAIVKQMQAFYTQRCAPEWERRDVRGFLGGAPVMHPFFLLSLMRSFTRFTEDLYFRPELVERALKSMTPDWIERTLASLKEDPRPAVEVAEERASAYYYPLSIFERFWLPYSIDFIDAMWSEGIVTVLHLDTDWSKNLPYLKRAFKRGSYMLQLDSMTDIFAAKEVMKGHAMFHGDLPAMLQAIGSVEDVQAYCRRLIDEVGYEGGFILGTGCETAPDFKPENLRAMIETGKTYELSRR
jgi:hypothetical protein